MLASWVYSPEKEALRILHTAHQIASGFYRLNGFIVLPYSKNKPSPHQVVFPDLNYLSIPRFWERVSRINIYDFPSINMQISPELVNSVESLLVDTKLSKPDYSQIQSVWSKYESDIISSIYKLIPSQKNSISSITVWPTILGTGASFSLCHESPHNIVVWLRQDKGIASLVEAVVTSLTRLPIYTELGGVWQESEIITDWLMTYSPLNSIIRAADKDWRKALTIKNTRTKQNGSLAQISNSFIRKIGAPVISPDNFNLDNFSPRDREIMQLLISQSPQPVTMDQIGDILFRTNPDQYSLFAISKAIQRLRDHLEQNGVSGSFIQTKRGEGYLLAN